MLSTKQLRIFATIAQQGSITKASQILNLTQPAVSASLGMLEKTLQVKLFDRIDRRIVLNSNGEKIYPIVLTLLERINALEQTFADDEEVKGIIKISASTTIGNYILPALMAGFKEKYPKVELLLKIANTAGVIEQIAHYESDIGFIEGNCLHSSINVYPFKTDELILFVKADHPLAINKTVQVDELKKYPFIIREEGSGSRQIFEQKFLPLVNHNINIFLELGSSSAIKSAVKNSNAIGCISCHAYSQNMGFHRLVCHDIQLTRDLFILQNKRQHTPFIVEEWIDWVCQENR
ncbi:LysR substrate-binding domain-containing protein [Facilibium subflavum]|uniref:LysR substrate-binding domain-containing protein n=1 Tax=Facilibium subflavum TaxID=2219058 RepID=UPI000E658F2C|nr:LysR substrate-binding domain-containing protein [Facilibium subflavum]